MTKKNKKHIKSKAWFISVRGSYLPVTWQAWLSYLPYIFYLVFSAFVGWKTTNNIGWAILFTAANWFFAFEIMTCIAKNKS